MDAISTDVAQRRSARRASDLVDAAILETDRAEEVERVSEEFALAVTPEMMDLMVPGDRNDPIFLQFVPTADELTVLPEELADPIGDDTFTSTKGIVHRYPDRVLLKPVHVCPVYCRFCFRREKVGPGSESLNSEEMRQALDYIRSHREIWEVILTGGDPMILPARRIAEIVRSLAAIDHVEVIRFHTRVPVVDPDRINDEVVAALKVEKPVYVVLHTNHARELTPRARAACARLVDAGIPMLCQSVLLKGVNDDPKTMEELLRALIRTRIKPYYLHQGDLAKGTSHLRTTVGEGQRIMRSLRGRVSGICQPTYVLDIPGGYGKVPIGPTYIEETEPGRYRVEDIHGELHGYPPYPGE